MKKKNQYLLYRSGRVGAFIYEEDNPHPIDINVPTNESATFDKSLLEQKFSDLFFEKKQPNELLNWALILGGGIIIAVLVIMLLAKSKGA